MSILTDPWDAIAAIGTIVSIAIVVLIFLIKRQKRSVTYSIISAIPLLNIGQEIKDKLQVLYDGMPVERMHLAEVRISNSGNQPIREGDFTRQISLGCGSQAEIFSAQVVESMPDSLKVGIINDGNRVLLEPTLLNSKDSFKIRMLVANFEEVDIDGRIVGVKRISKQVGRSRRYWHLSLYCMVIQIVSLILFMVNREIAKGSLIGFLIGSLSVVMGVLAVFLIVRSARVRNQS